MKFGVVVFPGSNCDHDAFYVIDRVMRQPVEWVWHETDQLKGFDAIILPGGFSYGDYLRTGAIARFSPVMKAVRAFAEGGGLVLGICNGFQILCESGLLPGALMRNRGLKFVCRHVYLRTENNALPFTQRLSAGQVLKIPIAHMEGNYYASADTLDELESQGRVVFRYSTPEGAIDEAANPNGAARNIAGICNRAGNVMGMMPHPERASESLLGSADGRGIFESMVKALVSAPSSRLAETVHD
ncbi:MAG: phosphoribosylformylglycinamidine synthase subunit PurQ [Acidobacteriia bacterium]|nr:phosphoribosylformylglycinamidine synthase subunit PurQ [Terriglobia bacterium]